MNFEVGQIVAFRFYFLLIFLLGVWGHRASAQEVIDVTRQGVVAADDPTASKQSIMDKVIEDVSLENIRGIIGDEKTQRSKDLIKNKIIKQSGKYILSVKGQNYVKKNQNYVMDVEMKLSLKGLRSLLLSQGLLYQMEGPPKVLPVVQIVDRVGGRSYGWWYPTTGKEHAFLIEQAEVFHKSLREQLKTIGFYSLQPVGGKFAGSVPETFRSESLQRADYLFLGDYFKSSIVTRGQILFRPKPATENRYLIEVRLEALQSGNGRLLAEVVRVYETDPGAARPMLAKKFEEVTPKLTEDLSAQLTEAWKKGTFGASVLKLAVVGKVSAQQLEEFKKNIVLQVRDIKALRERLIEARKTTYEIESSVLPQQLAQGFRSAQFKGFKVQVEDVGPDGLTVRVDAI